MTTYLFKPITKDLFSDWKKNTSRFTENNNSNIMHVASGM